MPEFVRFIAKQNCRKSKINRKCYRKCDFQAFDWLKFTLTTDLRLTTFCEFLSRYLQSIIKIY